jgi:two-component system cell cycle sensor histidine kinase/response regulator CckA
VTARNRTPGVWLEALLWPPLAVLLFWWAGDTIPFVDRPAGPFLFLAAYAFFRRGAPTWIALGSTAISLSLRPLLPGPLLYPVSDHLFRTLFGSAAFAAILYLGHRVLALTASARRRATTQAHRFQELMKDSPDGIWRLDENGVTREANRALADLLRCRPEDLVGQRLRDLVDPQFADMAERALTDARRGEPTQLEVSIRTRDREPVRALVTTHPIFDAKDRFVETFALVRDISARHLVESERHHALSLLEAALESTADGILIVDTEGKIVRFNERFARMWRLPSEILQSRDDARAVEFVLSQLADPEQFQARIRTLYATPEAESFDTLTFRDGRVFERYSLPQRVGKTVVGRVWSFRDVTERERAHADQRLALEREMAVARNLDTALFTFALDPDRRIIRYDYVSRGAETLYGVPARELEEDPHFWIGRVHPEDLQGIVMPTFQKLLRLQTATIEFRYETSKGIWRWHRSRLTPRIEADGVVYVDGIETDVSDRVALEEQFRHAQKMEAVGQLAGGVAHDFNNILTAVIGYADLLLGRLPRNDPNRHPLEEIRKGGERAASLTRQLLAFSRRAAMQPRIVDLNDAIRNLEPMVRALAGENVHFEITLSNAVGRIRVDPTQLEQVIVNLIVNARDAMPEGGSVIVRTDRVVVEEDAPQPPQAPPGAYARLRVTDTGIGIPSEVIQHIFEPFFTTKEPGRGTGLGLATVYGIVRQHGGFVNVAGAPGRGAEFEILLPEAEGEPEVPPAMRAGFPGGSERVLIVEDDPSLLTLARESLLELGYDVLTARTGAEALQRLEYEREKIRLLVTDVVMPQMGGRELAAHAQRLCPGLPVLYVSGYARDPALIHEVRDDEVYFLMKPYTPLTLARKVREALDEAGSRLAGDPRGIPR